MVLHEQDRGARVAANREQHQNDVMKRKYYMKMHGIEAKDPITSVFGGKTEESTDEEIEAAALGLDPPEGSEEKKPRRRKMWGII